MTGVFDELAARMDYHALFSEYVRLRKKGNRYFAVCPFHQEKDASMSVDVVTGLWHCFGCKEGGNAFTFIAKIEQLEMREVVEMLAQRLGVDLKQYQTADEREKLSRRQVQLRIMKAAAGFYRKLLMTTTHGQRALDYFHKRGLSDATINHFGLGVTPLDVDGLTKELQQHNARKQDLLDLNLSIEGRRGELIDMMRGRAIFPLFDHRGDVVGIAGRAMGDEEPKYLNTRNTPLYNKSRLLYGMNFARKAITAEDCVYVVEGYMDVISLHQAGVVNCVAACGTALTRDHVQALSRLTDKFYLTFDGDSAGISAALRTCKEFLLAGAYPHSIIIPEGQDPDELVIHKGKEGLYKLREHALTYIPLLTQVRLGHPIPDVIEMKTLLQEIAVDYPKYDSYVSELLLRDMTSAWKVDYVPVRDMLYSIVRALGNPKTETIVVEASSGREIFLRKLIVRALLNDDFKNRIRLVLKESDIQKGQYRDLYNRLVVLNETPSSPYFPRELSALCAQLKDALESESKRELLEKDFSPEDYAWNVLKYRIEDIDGAIRELERKTLVSKGADSEDIDKVTLKIKRLMETRSLFEERLRNIFGPEEYTRRILAKSRISDGAEQVNTTKTIQKSEELIENAKGKDPKYKERLLLEKNLLQGLTKKPKRSDEY